MFTLFFKVIKTDIVRNSLHTKHDFKSTQIYKKTINLRKITFESYI